MSFQEIFFKENKEEAWRQFAASVGGSFVQRGRGHGRVDVPVDMWTITLDSFTVPAGHAHVTFTRFRVPYVSVDGFRFAIQKRGPFRALGRLIGLQDIEIGEPDFDHAFIVKANQPSKVRHLLTDPALRRRLLAERDAKIEVKDNEGWFGPRFSESEDELRLSMRGVVTGVDQLRSLHEIVAGALQQLSRIGSASRIRPSATL